MSRPPVHLVIDARPRGPRGPLAVELIQGRCVLAHHVDLALTLEEPTLVIHARLEDHRRLRELLADRPAGRFEFSTGPPTEGTAILRTDRLYDTTRLRRALRRGYDLEKAVLWRLDQPHGLSGAEDELRRRQTYQPLGRYWALGPARALAKVLQPTVVRPNALTVASAMSVLGASAAIAFARPGLAAHAATAAALALGLVLDTADGHLARLQGTSSEFGRWLDALLDELGDMALHAAVAWGAFVRDGLPIWLVLGMLYGMGKYLFVLTTAPVKEEGKIAASGTPHVATKAPIPSAPERVSALTAGIRLAGHADVRWHLWIVLAAFGRLDAALVAYAVYFPARALAGLARKAVHHA